MSNPSCKTTSCCVQNSALIEPKAGLKGLHQLMGIPLARLNLLSPAARGLRSRPTSSRVWIWMLCIPWCLDFRISSGEGLLSFSLSYCAWVNLGFVIPHDRMYFWVRKNFSLLDSGESCHQLMLVSGSGRETLISFLIKK